MLELKAEMTEKREKRSLKMKLPEPQIRAVLEQIEALRDLSERFVDLIVQLLVESMIDKMIEKILLQRFLHRRIPMIFPHFERILSKER